MYPSIGIYVVFLTGGRELLSPTPQGVDMQNLPQNIAAVFPFERRRLAAVIPSVLRCTRATSTPHVGVVRRPHARFLWPQFVRSQQMICRANGSTSKFSSLQMHGYLAFGGRKAHTEETLREKCLQE